MTGSELEGQVALITGSGGVLGRSIALKFAASGARVVVNDVNSDAAETVAREIAEAGGRALSSPGDIRDVAKVHELLRVAADELGPVNILVNNAGVWGRHTGKYSTFVESEEATWDWILGVNVKGTFICTRAVLPAMIARGQGKIINIASVAGVGGIPRMVDYSASKGAIIAMTRALATEVAENNIQVNCISPGSIDIGEGAPPTLMNRLGEPSEVAELATFLASGRSNFITGQNHVIDGGRVLSTRW